MSPHKFVSALPVDRCGHGAPDRRKLAVVAATMPDRATITLYASHADLVAGPRECSVIGWLAAALHIEDRAVQDNLASFSIDLGHRCFATLQIRVLKIQQLSHQHIVDSVLRIQHYYSSGTSGWSRSHGSDTLPG